MDVIKIDLGRAVELVLAEIADKPKGYKYKDNPFYQLGDGCDNILADEDGNWQPGCLVGSVVIRAGVTPIEIFKRRGRMADSFVLLHERLEDLVATTTAADFYLAGTQTNQDLGNTWSESHSRALRLTLGARLNFTPEELDWLDVRKS